MQTITASDVATVLREMRDGGLSGWTRRAAYRVLRGTFSLALRRGIITLTDGRTRGLGTATAEERQEDRRPRPGGDGKANASASTKRWQAAIALAGYAGLRLGEVRGLRWEDVDLDANTISVVRSVLPDGTPVPPKSEAGRRIVPMLPALRRRLVAWKVPSPRITDEDYVIATHDGSPVQQRNAQRALTKAKEAAGLDGGEERLSWHSLRHSFASMLATDLELPATTLARIVGHADGGSRSACMRRTRATSPPSSATCSIGPPRQRSAGENLIPA